MKNFLVRFASGLIAAVIIVTAILASRFSYGLVVLIAAVGGVYEFYTITAGLRHADEAQNKKSRRGAVIMSVIIILLSWAFNFRYTLDDVSFILPVLLFIYFIKALFSKSENPFQDLAWNLLPIIYIILPVMLLNFLYFWKGGLFALAVLFLIWFYDSMCYIVGSLIGRTKLFERVSPHKTIEGLVGGMILTLTLAFFYDKILGLLVSKYHFDCQPYDRAQWLFIGFITLIFATLGDLVESQLKRSAGIKDSGSFMPGHGGFLDRLDAILVAIPFTVLAVFLMDRVNDLKLILDFINS